MYLVPSFVHAYVFLSVPKTVSVPRNFSIPKYFSVPKYFPSPSISVLKKEMDGGAKKDGDGKHGWGAEKNRWGWEKRGRKKKGGDRRRSGTNKGYG